MNRRPLSSVVIDSGTGHVYHRGLFVYLTRAEFEIFSLLWKRGGLVVEHRRIENWLYGLRTSCDMPDTNTVKVLICRLRPSILPLGLLIVLTWGQGYRLAIADQEERRVAA